MRSMICISLLAFSSFLLAEPLATSLEEKSVIQSLSHAFDMQITDGESNVYVSAINGDLKARQVSVNNSDTEELLKSVKTKIDKQSHYSNYTLLPSHNLED